MQRINLIKKEPLQITYGRILLGGGLVILICLLVYGFLWFRIDRAKGEIAVFQTEIQNLKTQREQLVQKREVAQGAGPGLEIQRRLMAAPPWPILLENLSVSLPSNVWLTSIKSQSEAQAGGAGKNALLINGQAKNAQALSQFLLNLEKNRHFSTVALNSSKEEETQFTFGITCGIREGGI